MYESLAAPNVEVSELAEEFTFLQARSYIAMRNLLKKCGETKSPLPKWVSELPADGFSHHMTFIDLFNKALIVALRKHIPSKKFEGLSDEDLEFIFTPKRSVPYAPTVEELCGDIIRVDKIVAKFSTFATADAIMSAVISTMGKPLAEIPEAVDEGSSA